MLTRRGWMGVVAAAVAAPRAHARPLFNGKDFAGWKQTAIGLWTIEDGAIVCRSHPEKGGPGYLFTEEEFGDFTLELDFWVSRGGNSGIFIRQPWREFGPRGDARPGQRPTDGVEIQIDYNDPKNLTGSVYNRSQCAKVVGGEERWNGYRIQCAGNRVTVHVDGQQVNDYTGLPAAKGAIGFQMHGAQPHDHVVRFRNVRITTG
ncbi:MAG: DUF1080 domain-containing protein [Bryobacterales bacterium]|nr:DUF1080 domain-containing protein [Bryobacterales bacterium]